MQHYFRFMIISYNLEKSYTIITATHKRNLAEFIFAFNAKKFSEGFNYSSGSNTDWESVESLRNLIKHHVASET